MYIKKNWKHELKQTVVHHIHSSIILFTVAKRWKQPNVYQQMNGCKSSIYTWWNIIQPLKGIKFPCMLQHGWPWKYTEWNVRHKKIDSVRFHLCKVLIVDKFIETWSIMVSRGWEERKIGSCSLMSMEVHHRTMEKFWRWIVVMLRNNENVCNATELYA